MQTVAEHVDADLREKRTARGLAGIALQHHVLIAIDGKGQSEYLVRAGARSAERRGASWSVVTVDTGRSADAALHSEDLEHATVQRNSLAYAEQQRQIELDKAFALARNLGGKTEVLHNTDVAQGLLDAAAANGASAIVIGRAREPFFARIFRRTLTQQLLHKGAQYELTVVGTPDSQQRARRFHDLADERLAKGEPALILLATLAAIATAFVAERFVGLQDLSTVFVVAVLAVASRTRMTTAVITAILCFLAYVYFFLPPRFTLLIKAQQGLATVTLFMAAALIAGRLASRLRKQVISLRVANAHANAMQNLARQLSKAADLGQVVAAGSSSLAASLGAEAWLRIAGESGDAQVQQALSEKELAAADWTQQHGQASGHFTDTLANLGWWFLPIRSDQNTLGVIGLKFPPAMSRLSFEQRRLAESMAEDIGQAALRTQLVSELESARVTGETERLRSALLSSVSHDLRSPLTAMIGSADSLMNGGANLQPQERTNLLQTIRMEGERLDRYIQNLLDMTRLGQQGLTLARDWIGVDELIDSASKRLQRYEPGVSQIHAHPALIEQALFNVMENAAKFSPPGEPVQVHVEADGADAVRIDISDAGPGIPEEERRRIFDMFYTSDRSERGKQGTGLGLTIVRGIIGAHMGRVEAFPGPQGRGTSIRLTLPTGGQPPG
jgi:two-component system sensor histidine kinase KdpD